MPTLLEQLDSATDSSSLSIEIGGQAANLLQVAKQVQQLTSNPPGDFAGYLSQLESLPIPQLAIANDLTEAFSTILPALQGDTSGLMDPLLSAIGAISSNVGGDIGETFVRLLAIIEDLQILFASDFSCGLVAAMSPLPAPDLPPADSEQPAPPIQADPPPAVLNQAQVDKAKTMVESLPADMSVAALLRWLHQFVGTHRPGYVNLRSIPMIDDIRDPLDSLIRWEGLTGTQLVQEINQTLNSLVTIIQNNSTDKVNLTFSSAAMAAIPAAELTAQATDLVNALDALQTAVTAEDTAAIDTWLATAQAVTVALENETLAVTAQQQTLDTLHQQIETLPVQVQSSICRLLVLLQPSATWADLSSSLPELPITVETDSFAPLTELFEQFQEVLENLLSLIDISSVTAPLAATVTNAGTAIEGVEEGIVQVTATVRAAFEQAAEALQVLDLESTRQQAEQAINTLSQEIQNNLIEGISPAVAALTQATDSLADQLDSFDPEQIAQPINQIFTAIKDIFQSPAVLQVTSELQSLKDLSKELDKLSFRPVGNLTVEGIETIKSALDSIDESKLVSPLPEMIHQAMSVVPTSLTPLSDAMAAELDELIEQGPVALLEAIRDLPQPLYEKLQGFTPRDLLEEPLSKPFNDLLDKLKEFQPTHWLDVAEQELESLRQRLAETLDLKPLLAPIVAAHQQLLGEFGAFRPGAILNPLTQAIEETLQKLDSALPTRELSAGLQQVFSQLQRPLDTLGQANQVLQSVSSRLNLLSDPETQFNQWLDEILNKLPTDAMDTVSVTCNNLKLVIQNSKAEALQAVYENAKQPLQEMLMTVNPQQLQNQLVQGKNRLTSQLADLAPSTSKTALLAWLTAFDPCRPELVGGLRQLSRLQNRLIATDTELAALLADWDRQYHHELSTLSTLIPASFTGADLQQWLREAIRNQLGLPLIGFLKQLKIIGALLQTFNETIDTLLQTINTKMTELLAAPTALLSATQQLDDLQQRISQLDLDIFSREIDSLYEQLMEQLRALDPRPLQASLKQGLTQALASLSLDLAFTPEVRQQLQDSYSELLAKIEGLNPEYLVIRPADEIYQQEVLPLIDALDLSSVIQPIIDVFNQFPAELQTEMKRVDSSFQQMLAAVPGGSSASASVSI